MQKIIDFLKSIVMPRKMYRYHDLKVIYSVLIFIVSIFVLLFSINISTRGFMEDLIGHPDFEHYNYTLVKEESDIFPKYQIATSHSGNLYLDCEEAGKDGAADSFNGVYNATLRDSDRGNTVILTVVFYENLDLFSSTDNMIAEGSLKKLKEVANFDLDGYINQERKDKTSYVLYIFTTKSFYYLYNLGQEYRDNKWVDASNVRNTSFECNTDGSYKYFLPKDESELVINSYGNYDISYWTMESTKDASATFNSEIKSERRLTDNLRRAINSGEYVYGNLETTFINQKEDAINFGSNENIEEVLELQVKLMAECDANIQKNMYSFFVVLINLIFPLAWVFITWLLSRKFVMSKFREYYAICSITYITTSVIGFILGFFMSFDRLMLILLMIELVYYIFVTFRINTDPDLLDENKDDDGNSKVETPKIIKPKTEFKKIQSDDAYRVE